jgi:hypothetical protein
MPIRKEIRAVAGGKDFMIKKEFRWGGERPLHLRANRSVHKTTHRFALRDDIVEVILETSNIVAGIIVGTITHKGHGNLIIRDGDVVDSGRSDLHLKE